MANDEVVAKITKMKMVLSIFPLRIRDSDTHNRHDDTDSVFLLMAKTRFFPLNAFTAWTHI